MGKREKRNGVLLAVPAVAGFLVFYGFPMVITLWQSISFGGEFVGLENYKITLDNYMFRLAVKNTVRFLLTGIPLIVLLALIVALLLAKEFPGNRFYRLSFLFPMMVPVASTVMVVQIFLAEKGVANSLLLKWGFSPQEWLSSSWAFWILLLLFLWKNIGYDIVLLLAGLAMIPPEYEETARLDGAGRWARFRYITLPFLKPMLLFTLLISVLNSFKCFREAFLIGGVHPHESIYMIQHYINNQFAHLNYTKIAVASSVVFSVIFLAAGVVLGWILYKKRKDW